jgi:hypothetical protein
MSTENKYILIGESNFANEILAESIKADSNFDVQVSLTKGFSSEIAIKAIAAIEKVRKSIYKFVLLTDLKKHQVEKSLLGELKAWKIDTDNIMDIHDYINIHELSLVEIGDE